MILIYYLKRQYLAMLQTDPVKYVKYLKKKGCRIGDEVYIYNGSMDMALLSLITIGSHVTLTGVTVLVHDASTKDAIGNTKIAPVVIGDHVFAGMGSIILAGTTIGDHVIIGAGTVVRGEVPANSVVVGNPWKVVCSYDEYIEKNRKRLADAGTIDHKDPKNFETLQNLTGVTFIP
ncbi:MAG: acyltransferase [Lachnospiraceae bacterium]|nr:acyltransferase [Lachnospiraceae bacterium]